ncbi:MAG TPA: MarR family transcriptional regulator [Acetobacteraceae bacterium]|nr:MarR family transcriptional regulator [Acetobacteraceae bacterium]
MSPLQHARLPSILRDTVVSLVRREGPDLTARQLGVLLICYLEEGPHTVRGLAARLNVAKPAITRALDRLEEFQFARRLQDPRDRRSIIVARTEEGEQFMAQLQGLLDEASRNTSPPRTSALRHIPAYEPLAAVG